MWLVVLMCLAAAVIELDNVSFGQIGLGRPFISGIIFGFLMGNVTAGVQLGIFTELLFLDFTPVGGVLPPNGTVAVLCAVMAACYGAPLYFAFFYGAAAGLGFRFVENWIRGMSARRLQVKQKELLSENPAKVLKEFIYGRLVFQVLVTFIVMLVAVYAAKTFLYYAKPADAHVRLAFLAVHDVQRGYIRRDGLRIVDRFD